MNYVNNIIYILATGSLLTGSILSFEYELPDYFFIVGSSLFLFKALLSLFMEIYIKNYKKYTNYEDIKNDALSII
jgi:hypothetical protein